MLLAPALLAAGTAVAAEKLPSAVKDLHYGQVLFEFYQQNYYSAAVDLLTAQAQGRLQHHDAEAQLLLGGLYLSYGLHDEAEAVFNKLLADYAEAPVRDRAWFYLGKIRYYKGLFAEAAAAFAKVGDDLDEALVEELRTLRANLHMAQEQYPEAIAALQDLSGEERGANYARFNLGVALVRAGREAEGITLLEKLGQLQSNEDDLKALRDKANLALAYIFLQTDPVRAKTRLSRIRLNGPFSTKALLGLGWAEVELQRFAQALVPWNGLTQRDRSDIAVLESFLARGNALERLRALPQAMQAYADAISVYEQELRELEATQEAVKAGRLWDSLLAQVGGDEMGWFWEAELLPDTPEARFLAGLMAGHEFHEAIKSLRDLRFLAAKLARWEQEVPALDDMLALRQATYEQQLNTLTPDETLARVASVRASRDYYFQELKRIEEAGDVMALATEQEFKLLARLVKMEERIWRLSQQKNMDEYADKYRFFKGLIEYDIYTTYAVRRWETRKLLKSLDAELATTLAQQESLEQARVEAPKGFQGFAQRISQQRERIAALQKQVQAAYEQQHQLLQQMVDAELVQIHGRLVDYLDQARFSLAHLQDLSASQPAIDKPVFTQPAAETPGLQPPAAQPPADEPATGQTGGGQ